MGKRNIKGEGEVRARIEAALDPSKTATEIARIVGCSAEYAQTVARANGVTLTVKRAPPHNPNGIWTEERVQALRQLYEIEGLSTGLVAERMGLSRNAVIGKVSRLGLAKNHAPGKPSISKPRVINTGNGGQKSAAPRINPDFDLPPPAPTDVARKTFQQLEYGDCRFPIDMPSGRFGFCADESIPGSPYCSHHHSRCYAGVPVKVGQKAPANDEREKADA